MTKVVQSRSRKFFPKKTSKKTQFPQISLLDKNLREHDWKL